MRVPHGLIAWPVLSLSLLTLALVVSFSLFSLHQAGEFFFLSSVSRRDVEKNKSFSPSLFLVLVFFFLLDLLVL